LTATNDSEATGSARGEEGAVEGSREPEARSEEGGGDMRTGKAAAPAEVAAPAAARGSDPAALAASQSGGMARGSKQGRRGSTSDIIIRSLTAGKGLQTTTRLQGIRQLSVLVAPRTHLIVRKL
jgi:hypothetical protein